MVAAFAKALQAIDALLSDATNGVAGAAKLPSAAPAAKPAAKAPAKPAPTPAAPKLADTSEVPAGEKEAKAPKAPKAAKAPAAPSSAAADRPIDVSWLDLRVGHILEAKAHPESDKLYIETIDVGEPEPRTILSGLAHYMPLEAVSGARVVVVCNLPARPLAGIASHGMVLCASDVNGEGGKTKTEFVLPPAAAKVGERITFASYPGEPAEPNKIKKKKAWETCAPDLATDAAGIATFKGDPWLTSAGPCTAASVRNGPIS